MNYLSIKLEFLKKKGNYKYLIFQVYFPFYFIFTFLNKMELDNEKHYYIKEKVSQYLINFDKNLNTQNPIEIQKNNINYNYNIFNSNETNNNYNNDFNEENIFNSFKNIKNNMNNYNNSFDNENNNQIGNNQKV